MKCIKCDIDNNFKDRTANLGRCKNCNHQFVFEPTEMRFEAKLTDPLFAKLIVDISANNTLFFTSSQLYYLLNKRLRNRGRRTDKIIGFIGTPLILIVLIASIEEKNILGVLISTALAIVAIFIYSGQYQNRKEVIESLLIDRAQFDKWLKKWIKINKQPKNLLIKPEFNYVFTPPKPEITAYSFDRVIVCDTPEIAQLLISNNFHAN